nr:hypothetical protein [Tanacetum cinerariifolium]
IQRDFHRITTVGTGDELGRPVKHQIDRLALAQAAAFKMVGLWQELILVDFDGADLSQAGNHHRGLETQGPGAVGVFFQAAAGAATAHGQLLPVSGVAGRESGRWALGARRPVRRRVRRGSIALQRTSEWPGGKSGAPGREPSVPARARHRRHPARAGACAGPCTAAAGKGGCSADAHDTQHRRPRGPRKRCDRERGWRCPRGLHVQGRRHRRGWKSPRRCGPGLPGPAGCQSWPADYRRCRTTAPPHHSVGACQALMGLDVLQLYLRSAFGGSADLADHPRLLAGFTQGVQRDVDVFLGHTDNHANAAVQNAVHFVLVDVALFLQPVENRRTGPAGHVDDGLRAFRQHARDVVQQATAGDVRHGLHRAGVFDQLEQLLDVNAGRRHQQVGQRLAVELDGFDVGTRHFDDLADQRVAVRMRTGGGQGDQRVAGSDLGAVDDLGFFNHTDTETGQVVVFAFVHAGHFSGFATDQRAAGQLTARTNAGDDLGCGVDVQFAGRVVIKEEQRLGAAHHQIVDAHGDEVDADGVVLVEVQGQTQLGADTVGAADQNRLLPAHHFRALGALGDALDAFDQRFTGGGLLAHDPGL